MKGFVAPLDPAGVASLYNATPWRFAGRSITVFARCDADAVAALVPAPLKPWGEPIVRFTVHELTCDLGFGWHWAQLHPHRTRLMECVVGIAVEHEGRVGHWDPFLWTDSDAELAVGREMFGWPQRLGTMAVTTPHPMRGWQKGDTAAARVARLTEPVLSLSVAIERAGEPDVPQPPFVGFFTERVLPDPAGGTGVRELYFSTMEEVEVADPWCGPAAISLHAPELLPLAPALPLAGRVNSVAWVKRHSSLVRRA